MSRLVDLDALTAADLAHLVEIKRQQERTGADQRVADNGSPAAPTVWDRLKGDADWPGIDPLAFHGPAGDFALEADPYTEADPIAVLVTTLTMAGCAINRLPHVLAGNDEHPARLSSVIVGATSKGGKGTSYAVANSVMVKADPGLRDRTMGGFGSGERVVDMLIDLPHSGQMAEGRRFAADENRLLIHEAEFSRVLRVAARDGSIASMVLRDAWDGRRLQVRSRAGDAVATGHHVCIVGHITFEELQARLSEVEIFNGFSNRFLWVLARRSKRLPEGGNVPDEVLGRHAVILAKAIASARTAGRISRTQLAERHWADLYEQMGDDDPGGALGAVISRDAPQCLRLSLLFALLDQVEAIDIEHVQAAWALWQYCRACAEAIFGDSTGNANADRLLAALKAAGDAGLDYSQQVDLFHRHLTKDHLQALRDLLEHKGLATTVTQRTAGRTRSITFYVAREARNAR
jgi:hypothetical protein